MNRKALIYVVKWLWGKVRKAPAKYSQYRPDRCELCERSSPDTRLPHHSAHPGRGKWVCTRCIYGGHPQGHERGYQNKPEDAMRFRNYGQTHAPKDHRNLNVIFSKRDKLNRSSDPDESR